MNDEAEGLFSLLVKLHFIFYMGSELLVLYVEDYFRIKITTFMKIPATI